MSAHTTMATSMANTIAIEHLHLMMCVLAGGSMRIHSKFACECDIACSQYHTVYVVNLVVIFIWPFG